MSNELLNRNKTNVDADLLAAKEEARRTLSDDVLDMVAGGVTQIRYLHRYRCGSCGKVVSAWDNPPVVCNACQSSNLSLLEVLEETVEGGSGDERKDMNEVLADIDGLMLDVDGWD